MEQQQQLKNNDMDQVWKEQVHLKNALRANRARDGLKAKGAESNGEKKK